MSLPRKPWPMPKVVAFQKRALTISVRANCRRQYKRADRLAKRFADLVCQTMDIDPHAPAIPGTTSMGTRRRGSAA